MGLKCIFNALVRKEKCDFRVIFKGFSNDTNKIWEEKNMFLGPSNVHGQFMQNKLGELWG